MNGKIRQTALIIILSLGLCGLAAPGAAVTHDLAADWSDNQNPNGCWSYNYGATPLTPSVHPWAPWGFAGDSDQRAWAKGAGWGPPDPDHTPAWFKVAYPMAEDNDAAIGDVVVHGTTPGVSWTGEPANVTWTSNLTGYITISGGVWYVPELLPRSMDWALCVKGNLVKSGNVHQGDPYSRDNPFLFVNGAGPGPLSFRVVPGDVVTLTLTKASGSEYAATVGINLRLEVMPPSAGVASVFLLLD
jgi:hypothetical protein